MSAKPLLIYLDQNKWSELNCAYHGLPKGARFQEILARVKASVKKQSAIFPLSSYHLIETSKIKDLVWRKRLAKVMVELSQGWTLPPPSYLALKELQVGIAKSFTHQVLPKPSVLGRGIPFAFGRAEEFHLDMGTSEETARQVWRALDSPTGLYMLLVGVDENANTRAIIDFQNSAESSARMNEERRQTGKLYSKSIRKRAYVASLIYHLEPELSRLLARYRKTFKDFLGIGKTQ